MGNIVLPVFGSTLCPFMVTITPFGAPLMCTLRPIKDRLIDPR